MLPGDQNHVPRGDGRSSHLCFVTFHEGGVDGDTDELAQLRDGLLRPLTFRSIAVVFFLRLADRTGREQKLRLSDSRSLKLAAQRCEEPGKGAGALHGQVFCSVVSADINALN